MFGANRDKNDSDKKNSPPQILTPDKTSTVFQLDAINSAQKTASLLSTCRWCAFDAVLGIPEESFIVHAQAHAVEIIHLHQRVSTNARLRGKAAIITFSPFLPDYREQIDSHS